MKPGIWLAALLSTLSMFQGYGQELKSFDAPDVSVLIIANIYGNVTVTGSTSQEITFELKTNPVTDDLRNVSFEQRSDTLIAYIQSECNRFKLDHLKDGKHWGFYEWEEDCEENDPVYVDFEVAVPIGSLKVQASTVNDGDILVRGLGTRQEVAARNVNGNIQLAAGIISSARTINGDLDFTFSDGEISMGDFYTLNGDIRATFPGELNANLSFESFNGDFFTNSSNVKVQPVLAEKRKDADGMNIKIGGKSLMQFGNGGPDLSFQTFNGDVIVKVNSP